MPSETPSLPQRAFESITRHWASRHSEIARFTATKYSFEEWLNWEAFAACDAVDGWRAHPKPRYCDLGATGCKDFGDLLVVDSGLKLLVEVGLVHDGTGDKWRDKLAWDVEKLTRPMAEIACLHIVVLASTSEIESAGNWQRWLAKVPCWNRPDCLQFKARLSPGGQMIIRGWCAVAAG